MAHGTVGRRRTVAFVCIILEQFINEVQLTKYVSRKLNKRTHAITYTAFYLTVNIITVP